MKKILLICFTAMLSQFGKAQTVIDFDTAAYWVAGSAALGSYAVNHSYNQGVFSAVAWPALRNGVTIQGAAPGALGTYSWRTRDVDTAKWEGTIASGGVGTFSIAVRRWDGTPSPSLVLESSTNGGSSWDSITIVNNTTLSNADSWTTFNGTINSSNNNIKVRLRANSTTERIMIDNFSWFPYSSGATVDTLATIASVDVSVLENVGTVDVIITLNQAPVIAKTVELVLNSGNAAVLNNYTTQTVTFPSGSTSQTVTLTVTQGQLAASSEVFDFSITNPSTGLVLGADVNYQLTVNQLPVGPTACSDLFFSEYIEGSNNNKALEIYNPTTSVVDLSNYTIKRYNNGATVPTSTVTLSGQLIPGGTYVIVNSAAFPVFLAQADLISGVTGFNGDDAMELYNNATSSTIDIIGEIGVDPGTAWTVGTGSTADFTLVRKATISQGELVWLGVGDAQWDVYTVNDSTHLGGHTNTSCSASIPLTAYPVASTMNACVGQAINFSHTSFGGTAPYTAGWEINSVQTPGNTLTYTPTAAGPLTVSFAVVDGVFAAEDSVFTIQVNPAPTNFLNIANPVLCVDDTTVMIASPSGGTSPYTFMNSTSANGVVFMNPNGQGYFTSAMDGTYIISHTVTDDLGCSSTTPYTVVVNPLIDATFPALVDFCANDTLFLSHTNTSGSWSGASVVDQGNGDGYLAGIAGGYSVTYTTTGNCPDAHTESVDILVTPTASFTASGTNTISFNSTTSGTATPTYSWDFGDGSSSSVANPTHTYLTNGTFTVCLTVANSNGCEDDFCQDVTIQGVGINENKNNKFSLYPNPSTGIVTIQTSLINPKMEVINLIGEVVYVTNLTNNNEINLSNFSKGTYFVKISSEGVVKTEKLIIK